MDAFIWKQNERQHCLDFANAGLWENLHLTALSEMQAPIKFSVQACLRFITHRCGEWLRMWQVTKRYRMDTGTGGRTEKAATCQWLDRLPRGYKEQQRASVRLEMEGVFLHFSLDRTQVSYEMTDDILHTLHTADITQRFTPPSFLAHFSFLLPPRDNFTCFTKPPHSPSNIHFFIKLSPPPPPSQH